MISQGTISVVCGCHSLMHSLLVVKAWRQIYDEWPELWELVCILLHDVGHVGYNYLDDPEAKAQHWRLGADIARKLFGLGGYRLVAGHCKASGVPQSRLYLADKVSWSLAPTWWLVWQCLVEPKLQGKTPILEHVRRFREWAAVNAARTEPRETHEGYLELRHQRGD